MCYPSQKRKCVQHHSSRLYYICKCEGHLYCTVLAMLSSHPFLSTTSIATNTYSVKLLHRGTVWQELVCWIKRIITRNIRNSYIGIEGKNESKEKCPRHKPHGRWIQILKPWNPSIYNIICWFANKRLVNQASDVPSIIFKLAVSLPDEWSF